MNISGDNLNRASWTYDYFLLEGNPRIKNFADPLKPANKNCFNKMVLDYDFCDFWNPQKHDVSDICVKPLIHEQPQ